MKRRFFCLLLIFISLSISYPASAKNGAVVLALSGGGTKGLAHIGVFKVLRDNNIPVAGIVGTSMGSIMGGLFASGYTPEELQEIMETTDMNAVILGTDKKIISPSDRDQISPLLPRIEYNRDGKIVGPKGPLSGASALDLFLRLTARVSVVQFDELPIPFAAVATDLETGEKVVIRHGSLAAAMRASMSIPGIFEPWPLEGRLLVDGGLVSNLPVNTAKELFPGYPVIAVNVCSDLRKPDDMKTMADVIDQTITILTSQNVWREQVEADVIIKPGVGSIATLSSIDPDYVIELGEIAAKEQLDNIKKVSRNSPPAPSIKPSRLRVVRGIKIEGVPDKLSKHLSTRFNQWIGKPADPDKIVLAADLIRSREDIKSVGYHLEEVENGVVIVLKVQRQPAYKIALDGYATNFNSGSWIGLDGSFTDLFFDGDYLDVKLMVGEDWATDFDYKFVADKGYYQFGAQFGRLRLDPANASDSDWDFSRFSVSRIFISNSPETKFEFTCGLAASRVSGGETVDTWGPMAKLVYSNLKAESDLDSGIAFEVSTWFPEKGEETLIQADAVMATSLSSKLKGYLKGGFVEGNSDSRYPGQGAYLGAREELFSLSAHPILSERFAWWRMGVLYHINEGLIGPVDAELFGAQGYAWDNGGSSLGEPWELGVALTIPSSLLKARLMAIYDDDGDWTFGFNIGDSMWSARHPFP